jgi:hypothetical protein
MITKLHTLIIYSTPRDYCVGHGKSYLSQVTRGVGLNFKDMDILFIKIIRSVGHNPAPSHGGWKKPTSEQLLM